MKFYHILIICCLKACLLIAGSASGQQKKIDTLQGITVESRRIPLLINTTRPVQTLAGEELKKLNSLSVADAVRFFSGVQLKDYGGIGGLKTINVRSMGSNHTAVYYDGMLLGNAQNGQTDLGKFSLDNIDSISLYSGQQNNIFQPARGFSSASSLNIDTKQPHGSHGKLSVKTGSFGLINPSLLWQQKITDRLYSTVSASFTQANGRYKFRYTNGAYDTTAIRNNGDIQAWRVEAALQGKLKDSSNWNFKVYGYQSERGLPGAIVANHFNYYQRLWDRDLFAQASWKKDFSKKYSFAARAKYTHNYSRYFDPKFNNEAGFLDNRYIQQEFYVSLANRYQATSWWETVLSADFTGNTLDADIYRFAYPVRYTEYIALASRIYFDRFELQGNVLGTIVDEKVRYFTGADKKRELTPSLSVSWQPFARHNLRLRAFYKDIFRMPTFNDLYYTWVGNVNLRPEYTSQYDIGFSYARPMPGIWQYVAIQGDAYYNEVRDKIVAVPAANLANWSMMNLDRVEIKGLDINIRTAINPLPVLTVNMGFNYTWQQAQDLTREGFNYGHQIPYTPWHSGSFTGGISCKGWDVNYSFIYTGERYSQKTNIPINYIEPWYTSDASVSKRKTIKGREISATAEVNNLLNQYYDVVLNFPMPGRYYRFTLSISY